MSTKLHEIASQFTLPSTVTAVRNLETQNSWEKQIGTKEHKWKSCGFPTLTTNTVT